VIARQSMAVVVSAVALAGAAMCRGGPRPRVVAGLARSSTSSAPSVPGRLLRSVGAVADATGRRAHALTRRGADPARDRSIGVAVLVAPPVALLGGPAAAAAVVFAAWAVPVLRARIAERHRAARVLDELPEVVDLFRVAIGAGLNIRLAVDAVARHGEGLIVDEVARAADRIERGDRVADVLAALAADPALGDPVRPLLDALVATERYGAPIGPSLDRAADDARVRRRRGREEEARRLPVRLLFPLVCCTLPALGLLTVVPALVRSFPSLGF